MLILYLYYSLLLLLLLFLLIFSFYCISFHSCHYSFATSFSFLIVVVRNHDDRKVIFRQIFQLNRDNYFPFVAIVFVNTICTSLYYLVLSLSSTEGGSSCSIDRPKNRYATILQKWLNNVLLFACTTKISSG